MNQDEIRACVDDFKTQTRNECQMIMHLLDEHDRLKRELADLDKKLVSVHNALLMAEGYINKTRHYSKGEILGIIGKALDPERKGDAR